MEIKERLKKQKEQFRLLVAELHGKTMDYETCRMLEDFLNDYSNIIFKTLEEELTKRLKDFTIKQEEVKEK